MEHLSFKKAREEATIVNAILLVTEVNHSQSNDRIVDDFKELA